MITLVTIAALLFLRDKRSRTEAADETDGPAAEPIDAATEPGGDGQEPAQAVPSPRGPIKLEWTESSG